MKNLAILKLLAGGGKFVPFLIACNTATLDLLFRHLHPNYSPTMVASIVTIVRFGNNVKGNPRHPQNYPSPHPDPVTQIIARWRSPRRRSTVIQTKQAQIPSTRAIHCIGPLPARDLPTRVNFTFRLASGPYPPSPFLPIRQVIP